MVKAATIRSHSLMSRLQTHIYKTLELISYELLTSHKQRTDFRTEHRAALRAFGCLSASTLPNPAMCIYAEVRYVCGRRSSIQELDDMCVMRDTHGNITGCGYNWKVQLDSKLNPQIYNEHLPCHSKTCRTVFLSQRAADYAMQGILLNVPVREDVFSAACREIEIQTQMHPRTLESLMYKAEYDFRRMREDNDDLPEPLNMNPIVPLSLRVDGPPTPRPRVRPLSPQQHVRLTIADQFAPRAPPVPAIYQRLTSRRLWLYHCLHNHRLLQRRRSPQRNHTHNSDQKALPSTYRKQNTHQRSRSLNDHDRGFLQRKQ
jgi:hypothetical protein